WDHGAGIDGLCWDDGSSGDYLTIDEMQTAIANQETKYSRKIDLISLDACYMNMIEVANELKDLADYFVASEESVPAAGYDYNSIMDFLCINPLTSPEDLAIELVNLYEDYYDYSYDYVTLSAINLSVMYEIIEYTNDFAGNLSLVISAGDGEAINDAFFNTLTFYADYIIDYKDFVLQILDDTVLMTDYPDLETAATNLLNEFSDLILNNYQHSCYSEKAYGISIFMPVMLSPYVSYITNYISGADAFENIDWLDETLWDEFLDDFYIAGFGEEINYLEFGVTTETTSISEDENQYYQFTVVEYGVYEIICHVFTGDADVYLTDSDFVYNLGFSAFWNPDDDVYEKVQTHLPVGNYHIVINGYTDASYNLVVNHITIEEISLNEEITGSSGTYLGSGEETGYHFSQIYNHYFAIVFDGSELGEYIFTLEYDNTEVDFDLYLFYINFVLLGKSTELGDIDSLTVEVTFALTLIICVTGYSGYGSFTVTVTSATPSSSINGYTWIISIFSLLTLIGLVTLFTRKRNLH
nr:hypothetical protein [Asgard group archaeon]